jgi:hypothetical protein
MYDYDGRGSFDEPSGREVLGWGPFYHCYEAADDWIFFAAPTERFEVLKRIPEFSDLQHLPEEDLHSKLAERFRTCPANYWRSAVTGRSAGVPLGSLKKTHDFALQRDGDDIDISRAAFVCT